MNRREEGWYWVKFVDDECAQWDGDRWFVAGMEGSVPESCFSEIGPRIHAPNEAPPIGTTYFDDKGRVVAAVAPMLPDESMLDAVFWAQGHTDVFAVWTDMMSNLPEPGEAL